MKPFRLVQVLAYRERTEATMQQQYADLVAQVLMGITKLQALTAEQQRLAGRLTMMQQSGQWDAPSVDATLRYFERLNARVQEQIAEVDRLEQAKELARLSLVSAAQDHEVIERLKDRHDQRQLQEDDRREVKEADSMTAARAIWRNHQHPQG